MNLKEKLKGTTKEQQNFEDRGPQEHAFKTN